MRISDRSLEEVKEKADILSVASEFGTFRRQGSVYVALCLYPDHQEKTPSFSVTPGKNLFHCFGCKRGGDAIKLIMDLTGAEFGETVERLADQFDVELEYEGGSAQAGERERERERRRAEEKEALRALLAAAEDYHAYLMRSPDAEARRAREYLAGRGFTTATLEAFKVGCAPSSSSATDPPRKGFCMKAGERHGLSGGALAAAGLAKPGRHGEDFFEGRITFPFADARGRVVGFGARVLPDDSSAGAATATDADTPHEEGKRRKPPKYINSPESGLFNKRKLLYGFDRAQKALVGGSGRRVVVAEGYTDVMMLHQWKPRHNVCDL